MQICKQNTCHPGSNMGMKGHRTLVDLRLQLDAFVFSFQNLRYFSQNWCKYVSKTLATQAATARRSGNEGGATSCDFWLLSIFQVLLGSVVACPFKNKLPIFSSAIHVIQGKVIAKQKICKKRNFQLPKKKRRTLVLNLEPKLWFAHVFNVSNMFSKGTVFLGKGIGSWPGANLVFTSDTFRIIWEVFESYLRGFRIIWEVFERY